MRILILNWRDINHPLAGGAEQSLHEHAKHWTKMGASVTWISSSFKSAKKNDVIDNIHVKRTGSHYSVHFYTAINYLFQKSKYDLIIDCFHFVPYFSPLYSGTKILAWINEPAEEVWFENLPFPIALLGYKAEPFFFKIYKSTNFVTSATSIKKSLISKYSINENKIHIIHHGVTTGIKVKSKKIDGSVIFLARLSKDKGIEDAIKAVSMSRNYIKKFHIVGKAESKSYEQKIKKMLEMYRIEKISHIHGYVTNIKKFNLLSTSKLLIHPSKKEGWGLNVIEANFYGTPAIGYKVTGLKDSIKDKKTGLLVDKNPESLSGAINDLLNDKKKYNNLSKNALNWSSNFSWDKSTKKSWNLISSIVEN